ncbi:MAG: tetratricopeptide repeat protein [Proteobacteria bacterium]|nr:tetratricopeptide repeat protein [Pseudomonadota bacterium]
MVESDEEQLEVLKKWWDENGTSLIVTVVLSLSAVFGYRAWESNVQETGEAASSLYEDMVVAATSAVAEEPSDAMSTTAMTLGESLKADHPGSTYSVFAAMHIARLAVARDDLEKAESELRWALEHVDEKHLEAVIRMRLARVLTAREDATQAVAIMLGFQPAAGQRASWEETLGDVYLSLGDQTQARQSYQTALENLSGDVNKTLLELKLANIPLEGKGSVSAPADEAATVDEDA